MRVHPHWKKSRSDAVALLRRRVEPLLVSELTGISDQEIYRISKQEGIDFKGRKERTLNAVRYLINERGIRNDAEIARLLKMSVPVARSYRKELVEFVDLNKRYLLLDKRNAENVRKTKSLDLARKEELKLEMRDRLILRGLPFAMIAEKTGDDRHAIYEHSRSHGLHDAWKISNKHYLAHKKQIEKSKKEKVGEIVGSLVDNLTSNLSSSERTAFDGTMKYFSKHRLHRLEFGDLYGALSRYYESKESGVKKSLANLCKGFEIVPNGLKSALELLGEKPLNWTCTHRRSEEVELINYLLKNSDMSSKDIAYFMEVRSSTLSFHVAKLRSQGESRFLSHTSYRKASEVYEAVDAGIKNLDDISELTGLHARKIKSFLKRRDEIEPKIIEVLKKISPEREITRPYL